MRLYHEDDTLPRRGEVFVFGSNLAGRHGAGAAKVARDVFGFPYGVGEGRFGQAYAIPTKDTRLVRLTLDEINEFVHGFIRHAAEERNSRFFITSIGCGLAGYSPSEIAPMFVIAPTRNCSFPHTWRPYLDL